MEDQRSYSPVERELRAEIARLKEELSIARAHMPRPPVMRTYRSDDEGRPVSRPIKDD